jgi:signal transduction histidine kinase
MKNIILVEDDWAVLEMLKTYVLSKGDKPFCFKNGHEVVEFLNTNSNLRINLLLTDYEMSPMNGIELIQYFNSNNFTFPKILITSHNEKHIMIKAIESQIFRFIEKPLNYKTLDQIYESAIEKDHSLDKEDSLKKIGEAYGSIIHEINNPLSLMIMFTDIIKQTYEIENSIDPAKLMSQLDTIQTAGFKIDQIIKDVKEFINQKPSKIENFQLSSIKEEILNGYKVIKGSQNVSLRFENFNDILVRFDRGQFYRIIINLLTNAVDATSDLEQKWIQVIAKENKDNIEIRVVDSGTGISAEIVTKLFSSTYSEKKSMKGTGLGLSICRKILQGYNSQLDYELFNGQTSFIVKINKN